MPAPRDVAKWRTRAQPGASPYPQILWVKKASSPPLQHRGELAPTPAWVPPNCLVGQSHCRIRKPEMPLRGETRMARKQKKQAHEVSLVGSARFPGILTWMLEWVPDTL